MRIPTDETKRLDLYREVREACLASRDDRLTRYAQNRRWYFHGVNEGDSPSRSNKIYSHLDTVASFLFASDTTRFNVKLTTLADKTDYERKEVFAERVNEKWNDSNADIVWSQGVLWSLVYDSTIIKHIRRCGTLHPFVVDPACFGVYRDDVMMLDRQEAFIHVYYMTQSDLERQLALHPRRAAILQEVTAAYAKKDTSEEMPALNRLIDMVQTETNLIGEVNIATDILPEYRAEISVPLIEMGELWIWNDDEDDYQVVTMASEVTVVYDRRNIFMPRSPLLRAWEAEHPFVQCCPNPLFDYFWGASELERLVTLQAERNEIKAHLAKLQRKQVDPPSAWSGMGIIEEKLAAFNDPGAQISVGKPPPAVEKSRSRTEASSSAMRFSLAHVGSRTSGSDCGPTARLMNSLAIAAAISLADSAASAGHRNARAGKWWLRMSYIMARCLVWAALH